jgi:hypothetical protein
MKTVNEAKNLGSAIDPKHEIEVVCGNCGYDVNEAELSADTCSDWRSTKLTTEYKDLRDKHPRRWRQHVSVDTGEIRWLLM